MGLTLKTPKSFAKCWPNLRPCWMSPVQIRSAPDFIFRLAVTDGVWAFELGLWLALSAGLQYEHINIHIYAHLYICTFAHLKRIYIYTHTYVQIYASCLYICVCIYMCIYI